jgi:hypothetical protein
VIDLIDPRAVKRAGEEEEYLAMAALAHAALAGQIDVPGAALPRQLLQTGARPRAQLETILVARLDEGNFVPGLGLMPVEVPQELGGGREERVVLVAQLLLEAAGIIAHGHDDEAVAARDEPVPQPLDGALLEHAISASRDGRSRAPRRG